VPRPLHKLSAVAVRSLGPGKFNDGAGLWLFKRQDGGGQWVLRVTINGKRREMGLGGTDTVSLKQAREHAARYRAQAREGRDPVLERQKKRAMGARSDTSLRTIAFEAFEARKADLKGDGEAGRWFSPLANHVLPKLGKIPVEAIDQTMIRDVLAPIWHTKADVARKGLNRTGIVLRHAAAKGLDVDLQATAKAKELLGKSRHEPKNIPAMAWQDVPAFYATLTQQTPAHLAMRLLILTGVRSGALRSLRIEQIDDDLWTIPASLMKGRRGATSDFRVPLSGEALSVIDLAMPHARNGFLFASHTGRPISDMTLSKMMERRGLEARPHGFRSSLRVWLAEQTDAPVDIAETILAHTTGNKVTRAYQRSDYIEQRRVLMERWANHVTSWHESR